MFTWDEFRSSAAHDSDNWATTDRGWCHIQESAHPDLAHAREVNTCCGNYLQYPTSRGPNGEEFHASAYLLRVTLQGLSSTQDLGHGWFATAADARTFIEDAVGACFPIEIVAV
jgi:hypothetical protein